MSISHDSDSYQQQKTDAVPTVSQLKRKAHLLIDAIGRRLGAVKLLLGVLPLLEVSANYKVNRRR